MGPIPCNSQSQVITESQSFRPVAAFFSGKSTIFGFFYTERVLPYRHAHDVPLVTLILNI